MKRYQVEIIHKLIGEWDLYAESKEDADRRFSLMDAKGEMTIVEVPE